MDVHVCEKLKKKTSGQEVFEFMNKTSGEWMRVCEKYLDKMSLTLIMNYWKEAVLTTPPMNGCARM